MPLKSGTDKEEKNISAELAKSVKVYLLEKDHNTILCKSHLDDKGINESQNILKKQFPNIGGWQDTLLCQIFRFAVSEIKPKSLGLFNIDQWTFAGLGQFVQREAYVIDGNTAGWMLTNLGHGQDPYCGTAACTNTTGRGGLWLVCHRQYIWTGSWKWPVGCLFWPRENAQAFSSIFGEMSFWTFPRQSNTSRFNKRQTCNIYLFYYCSMPECWDDMVQCELCAEWLHMSCKRFKTATESEWLIDVDLHLKKELRVLIVQNRNTLTYHRLYERLCSKSSYFALVQKLYNVI